MELKKIKFLLTLEVWVQTSGSSLCTVLNLDPSEGSVQPYAWTWTQTWGPVWVWTQSAMFPDWTMASLYVELCGAIKWLGMVRFGSVRFFRVFLRTPNQTISSVHGFWWTSNQTIGLVQKGPVQVLQPSEPWTGPSLQNTRYAYLDGNKRGGGNTQHCADTTAGGGPTVLPQRGGGKGAIMNDY